MSDDLLAPVADARREAVQAFLAERVADCTVCGEVITRATPRRLAKEGLEHVHCQVGAAPKPPTDQAPAAVAARARRSDWG